MKLTELIRLNEATFDIDEDVDMIYEKGGFKDFLEEYHRGGYPQERDILNGNDVLFTMMSSEDLKSEDCKKAHEMNPIKIKCGIFSSTNHYNFRKNLITLKIHKGALQYMYLNQRDLSNLPEDQHEDIQRELTEDRKKGTIAHELSHWLDNTFHNNHMNRSFPEAGDHSFTSQGEFSKKVYGRPNINLAYMEIEAQIHAIKDMKRNYSDEEWDKLTLSDLYNLNPSLRVTLKMAKSHGKKHLKQYFKDVVKRLHREGLLGKNMRSFK